MRKRLRTLDIFGQQFSLNAIKGSKTYKTIFGGLLSLFGMLVMSIVAYKNISQFLDTQNPLISTNKLKVNRPLKLDLLKHQMMWLFGMSDDTDYLKVNQMPRYVTFRADMITTTQNADGTLREESKQFDMVDCRKITIKENRALIDVLFNQSFSETLNYTEWFSETSICLNFDPKNWYLQGSPSSLPYRRYVFRIYPCSLETLADCASILELSNALVGFVPLIKATNFSNQAKPLIPVADPDNADTLIDVVSKNINTLHYKENFIYDKEYSFMGSQLYQSYIDVDKVTNTKKSRLTGSTHCSVAQIDAGLCESYLDIVMRSSGSKVVITRNYKTLFDTLSEIGGFHDLVVYVFWAFYHFCNYLSYNRWIRSQLVDHFVELQERAAKVNGRDRTRGDRSNQVKNIRKRTLKVVIEKERNSRFRVLFGPKIDLKMMLDLSFKSKVIIEMLKSHNGPSFFALTHQVLHSRRRRRLPGSSEDAEGNKDKDDDKNPIKKPQKQDSNRAEESLSFSLKNQTEGKFSSLRRKKIIGGPQGKLNRSIVNENHQKVKKVLIPEAEKLMEEYNHRLEPGIRDESDGHNSNLLISSKVEEREKNGINMVVKNRSNKKLKVRMSMKTKLKGGARHGKSLFTRYEPEKSKHKMNRKLKR